MAALTANRFQSRSAEPDVESYPVAASAVIFQGAIIVSNAAGFAAPGTTATGLVCLGVAQEAVNNASGANGDKRVTVRRGVYKMVNDPGDLLVAADVGRVCYITDDQTVSKTLTGKSKAGTVREILSDGVRVELGVGALAS